MGEITGNDNGDYLGIEVGANYSWDNFIRMYTGQEGDPEFQEEEEGAVEKREIPSRGELFKTPIHGNYNKP